MNEETLGAAVRDLACRLAAFSDSAALDAQTLLAHIIGKGRAWVLAHPEAALSAAQRAALAQAVTRLENGEPLPYVLGHWEFFALDFIVNSDVLIPRPESELLVETALQRLAHSRQPPRVLDVGTGCGCIAIALAAHNPQARLMATDISAAALQVARRNAARHRVAGRIRFIQADLLPTPLPPFAFDVIVANLPYIPTAALQGLPIYRREPRLALDGGSDGLTLIRRLVEAAPTVLAAGGALLCEIEASQGLAAANLAQQAFPAASVSILPDLAGHDRLLSIQT